MADKIYIFDTSSLIESKKLLKYADVLVSLWSNLGSLVSQKRLMAPKKVLEDLIRHIQNPSKNDELINWAKNQEKLFRDENDQEFINALKTIANKHAGWVDPDSDKNQSDLYVVALAVAEMTKLKGTLCGGEVIVVTEESQDPNRLKIPKICTGCGVRCVNLHQFFKEEGWQW